MDPSALLGHIELAGLDATRRLNEERRGEMGQFLTPPAVARFMASLFSLSKPSVTVLDPGAGAGMLSAAFVVEMAGRRRRPETISVTAYEMDPVLLECLEKAFVMCQIVARSAGMDFVGRINAENFLEASASMLSQDLYRRREFTQFDYAILNPPYRKIHAESSERRWLRDMGIETSNLYTGFLAAVARLLDAHGQLVAITPRSFCNGLYFRSFRRDFLETMTFRRVHVFDSRQRAFSKDEVLQENIIFHAQKDLDRGQSVVISSSTDPQDDLHTHRRIKHEQLIGPNDPDAFIHIVPDELGQQISERMRRFTTTLAALGLNVSTGRVVGFRARSLLRQQPEPGTVPLIHPCHFSHGFVSWPARKSRKPNAIARLPAASDLLVPSDYYVLVKRFSSKEEPRRITSAVYDPRRVGADHVGIENHLNYYHRNGRGLDPLIAKGLAAFLNSTAVDSHFRQFNGHTQVNATDLRSMKYPGPEELRELGRRIGETFPNQHALDEIVQEELFKMTKRGRYDPIQAKKKVAEALEMLRALRVPREQQNDRSALTLLVLCEMKPGKPWSRAGRPLLGITEMMGRFTEHFGRTYAPNTRETVRRQTVHQFVQLGLVNLNPDNPNRAVNSPHNRYQLEPSVHKLVRSFGSEDWERNLETHLATADALKLLQPRARAMQQIPVTLPDGKELSLTAGLHNLLVKEVLEQFCPRYTPGGIVMYVGDVGKKHLYFDADSLAALGIKVDRHGKMPDVVIYDKQRNWLVLVEAVTSHGPMTIKRQIELKRLFKQESAGLVFVTAFSSKRIMVRYLNEIAWETDVWLAEFPDHLVHFNGVRFLGPYE